MNAATVIQTVEHGGVEFSATAEFRRANGTDTDAGVTLNQTSSTGNRSGSGSGIFGTALTQNWRAYQRSGGHPGRSVGAYFTGLEPGEYDVYAVVHNPVLIAAERTTNVGIGVGSATSGDLAWNDSSLTGTSFAVSPQTDTWELGVNYAKVRVEVTAENPNIYVIQGGPAAANDEFDYHTLAAVQIVAVVEELSEFEQWMEDNAGNLPEGATGDTEINQGGVTMTVGDVYTAGLDPEGDELFRLYWDENGEVQYQPDLGADRNYTTYWTDDLTADPVVWTEGETEMPETGPVFYKVKVELP